TAEDTGTNNLENTLPAPAVIHAGTLSAPFTLNVPTMITAPDGSPTTGSFDLFASALGQFEGAGNPFPGLTVAVQSGVSGTAVPLSSGTPPGCMPTPNVAPTVALTLGCAGHGSISGLVNGPDTNTFVELEKSGVQLFEASPVLGPPGPTSVPTSTAF